MPSPVNGRQAFPAVSDGVGHLDVLKRLLSYPGWQCVLVLGKIWQVPFSEENLIQIEADADIECPLDRIPESALLISKPRASKPT